MTEKYKKKKRNNLFLQKPHRNVNTENIFSVNTLLLWKSRVKRVRSMIPRSINTHRDAHTLCITSTEAQCTYTEKEGH